MRGGRDGPISVWRIRHQKADDLAQTAAFISPLQSVDFERARDRPGMKPKSGRRSIEG